MDEKQYRTTYQTINPERCVFEKAINSRICNCSKSQRFNLADREGVACTSKNNLIRCTNFISLLREHARFALQQKDMNKKLPHAQESKIQNGGLLGLQAQTQGTTQNQVLDIDALINLAEEKFISLQNFPYSKIMQSIVNYQIRKRSSNSKSRNI